MSTDTPQTGTGFEDLAGTPENWVDIGAQVATGAIPGITAKGIADMLVSVPLKTFPAAVILLEEIGTWAAGKAGKLLVDAEEPMMPLLAAFIAPIIANMFGSDAGVELFQSRLNRDQRGAASRGVVDAFMGSAVDESSGPIEPDAEPAKRLAAAGVHAAMEGWLNEHVPELLAQMIPFVNLHLEAFAGLSEEIIGVLGIGRLVRQAIQPLVHAAATTPMAWDANKKYRPTKLAPSTAIREFLRGRWTQDQLAESLARDGYRDEYHDALVNEAKKVLDPSDLAWLLYAGIITEDAALQTMREQGYDEQTASKHLNIFGLKHDDTIHRELATAAVTAYVDRRIESSQLDAALTAALWTQHERDVFSDVARARRALNVRGLSPAEAAACAKVGIVPVLDYRAALERQGYDDDAVYALELLLRHEMDQKAELAKLKATQDAERAAAAKVKAAAAALHAQDVADAKAIKALGPVAVLENAVIRGVIPMARLEQALARQFPADTVAIYVADVESKRQAFLEQERKAADAAKRAANKGLSTGELRTAMIDGVLSAEDVRRQLVANGLPPADVNVLIASFQIAADAHREALALRAAAARRAAQRGLSLAQADALARAGHWTAAQYHDFLITLGFTAVDVASLEQLLADEVAKDAAAAAARARATAASTTAGLTLEQERRAVILGVRTLADFGAWLTAHGFSAPDIATLLAETKDAADTALAVRARRAAAAGAAAGTSVPFANITRAAQLGILSPADYAAALEARGYSSDAVALELDLLATEIAAQHHPAPAPGTAGAILVGSPDTPFTTATARRAAIDDELAARGLSLATTEAAVREHLMSLDAFQSWLEANGAGPADADLLGALLAAQIAAAGG